MKKIHSLMMPAAFLFLLSGCSESGQNEDTRQYRDGMENRDGSDTAPAGTIDQNDTLGNSNESSNPHLVE